MTSSAGSPRFGARRGRAGAAAAVILLVCVAVAIGVIVAGSDGERHRVYAIVPEAANVVTGQEIRSGGRRVGEIAALDPVRGGRAARLELRLDDSAWPVHRGTHLALRWGGTISYDNRYVAMQPGPSSGPVLADGAVIPSDGFQTPVELDQLLTTFTTQTRADLTRLIERGGLASRRARRPLARALDRTPPAANELGHVLRDLDDSRDDLDTLVRSTDAVVFAVDRANPGIGRLISGAATTFNALAVEAASLSQTLNLAPATLATTRRTLAHADHTLNAVAAVTDRLRPGVAELRRISRPLNGALDTVVAVGPDARASLSTARRAAPRINRLLARVTSLAPQLGSISDQAATALKCIRPYSPEIAAFFSTWGDFLANTDGRDRYQRGEVAFATTVPMNAFPLNAGQLVDLAGPGRLAYAFPAPPGYNAAQPWFLPECGAGPDALNPHKDPEAREPAPKKVIGTIPSDGTIPQGPRRRR